MSLPPGFLDELRQRLTLSDVVGRKVIWDARKSQPSKGDFWSPCPFHQEKTPSFHVDDRKGFYYCFGCQAKGDLISFVTETENMGFMEAVEFLAREAGVEMPERTRDPRAAEKRDRHQRLFDVMEQAVRAFGLALRSAAGTSARDYVAGRGLSDATLKRFEIGYAPGERGFLANRFREAGVVEEAVAAGLLIAPEDGGAPFDRFRNRLMFPIRDGRGRCIAFGGRAMSDAQNAKYLNSPETEIFHKGRTLYHHGPAREAAGKVSALIVAEGYMDVIALAQAGFDHAVAPLGTAITGDQLALLWRIADEPVIALDGDPAGLRAAERLVDLALPMLAPGKSLRFCLLPEGRDPDDLIRAGGPDAMAAALDDALPLVEMLWRRETEREVLDTPERRAALDTRLRALLQSIQDPAVRNHYAAEVKARRAELFRPRRNEERGRSNNQPRSGKRTPARSAALPVAQTRASALARQNAADAETRIREAAILLIALRNPAAIAAVETALEDMSIALPEHARIRDALMEPIEGDAAAHVTRITGLDPEAVLTAVPQARAHPMARPGLDPRIVATVLEEALGRHAAQIVHATEMRDAMRDLAEAEDEGWSQRVAMANRERQAADLRVVRSAGDSDEGPRESGIQRLLDQEVWRRSR